MKRARRSDLQQREVKSELHRIPLKIIIDNEMKTLKRLAVGFVLFVALGFASCSEDAYYEDPIQPLPPEEITQPLPPIAIPHGN